MEILFIYLYLPLQRGLTLFKNMKSKRFFLPVVFLSAVFSFTVQAQDDASPLIQLNLEDVPSFEAGEKEVKDAIPNDGELSGFLNIRQGEGTLEIVESDFNGKKALKFSPTAEKRSSGAHLPCVFFPEMPAEFPGGCTFQAWVKPDSRWMGSRGELLSARRSDQGPGMALAYRPSNGGLEIISGAGSGQGAWGVFTGTNNYIPADEWSHVAAVYDAEIQQFRLYINGEFIAESEVGLKLTPMNPMFTIGAYNHGYAYAFGGEMLDIAVYDYPRTEEQIRADAKK